MMQLIKQALINEYIYKDIMAGVTLPHKNKTIKRALTDSELSAIAQADLDIKSCMFVGLLLYTGVRPGHKK